MKQSPNQKLTQTNNFFQGRVISIEHQVRALEREARELMLQDQHKLLRNYIVSICEMLQDIRLQAGIGCRGKVAYNRTLRSYK